MRRGPFGADYRIETLEIESTRPRVNTRAEGNPVETLAEKSKADTVTVKRPDFAVRLSRGSRGIMLHVQSEALSAHLKGLADGRTTINAAGRTVWNVTTSRLRNASLFGISEPCTALLLDAALDAGHEIKIADVMNAPAAKDYVRDLMGAFSEYVRDYMSALCITGTVTVDETVTRKPVIRESV